MGEGSQQERPLGALAMFYFSIWMVFTCDNLLAYICNICAFTCIIIHNIKAIKKKSTDNFRKAVSKEVCLWVLLGVVLEQDSDLEMVPGSPAGKRGSGTGQRKQTWLIHVECGQKPAKFCKRLSFNKRINKKRTGGGDFGRRRGFQCHRGNVADQSSFPGGPQRQEEARVLIPQLPSSRAPPGRDLLGRTSSALGPRRSPRVKTQGARRALHAQDVGFWYLESEGSPPTASM